MNSILIIEDDDNLRLTLQDNLDLQGYRVQAAANINSGKALLHDVDLLILDIMLPDGDGYSLCQQLRTDGWQKPILMLTARTLEDDLVKGFQAGADDYLAKPYRLRELLMRVEALLRRGHNKPAEQDMPGYTLDRQARRLANATGQDIALTPKEFNLLLFLVDHANQALSRDQILNAVWGEGVIVDPRTVDNFVSNLKKKLALESQAKVRLNTVRGIGYRFEISA